MTEAYAFLATFTGQILAMSVLYPARFDRHVRLQAASMPTERLAQLYPGIDLDLARERFLTRYRRANTGIAVLGLLLLGWLFSYMRRPDWNEDPVVVLLSVYFVVQILPLGLVCWLGFVFNKEHKRSLLAGKRKAMLQRRGLFDFASPFIVFVAVSGYFLFAGLVVYVRPEPSPGFALLGVLTLVYALEAVVVYRALYGRNANPLETYARRRHTIGLTVKVCIYSCIVCVVFFVFTFTLDLLDMRRWMPFAQSACLLVTSLLCLMGLGAPPREPEAGGFDSDGRLTRAGPPT
jgi:MFS family permease